MDDRARVEHRANPALQCAERNPVSGWRLGDFEVKVLLGIPEDRDERHPDSLFDLETNCFVTPSLPSIGPLGLSQRDLMRNCTGEHDLEKDGCLKH